MGANSDQQFYGLYMELAGALACRERSAEATDAYALALYYARRMGNRPLVDFCRGMIAEHNPSHVACRESSAPLFFAQLLMRYPIEKAHAMLADLKDEADDETAPFGSVIPFESPAPATDEPSAAVPIKPYFSLGDPTVPENRGSRATRERSHHHRPAPPTPDRTIDLRSRRPVSSVARPKRAPRSAVGAPPSLGSRALHAFSVLLVGVGLVAIAFFGAALAPRVNRTEIGRAVKVIGDSAAFRRLRSTLEIDDPASTPDSATIATQDHEVESKPTRPALRAIDVGANTSDETSLR